MANPSNRTELRDYCLRKLGFPVIDINVDDDQLEDRIDDAIQLYHNFHFDGTQEEYLGIQVSTNDIANGYVTLADTIIGVEHVLPVSSGSVSSTNPQGFNIFDINYQIRLNDFYNLTSSSYTYYYIARSHLSMLDMIVTGEVPFTYNKKTNILKIILDWDARLDNGRYIVIKCRRIVDPDNYAKVYNDTWLKEYTTQLFKRQWGENLKKYGNYVLPGGLIINGQTIYDEAIVEIGRLEEKLRDVYEEPVFGLMVG